MIPRYSLLILAFLPLCMVAQDRYATRTGHISFLSEAPLENIQAENRKVTCVLDAATGAIEVAVLIRAFEFEKALMQEHFNDSYMESVKFPKAVLKGTMTGAGAEDLRRPGTYRTVVKGELTIHGVTRQVEHPGTITVEEDGTLKAASDFVVRPADHDIKIPGVVRRNIAEEIAVKVRLHLIRLQ